MDSSAKWLRTEQIFHEVVGASEVERVALLEAHCGEDTALMLELRSLLDACNAEELHKKTLSAGNLQGPEWNSRVGPYAIDRLLGRGGMGTVYLAHRVDGQFDQQVAIKIIDMPLATDLFRDRFRTERQILAGLSHPYIARLLDGGVSEDGELYLAMEYIEGISITNFCETQGLGVRERLTLFKKVCEAVQYAHQNLIVHRDLKPDNILVAVDGSPRLLDFGTAKILTPLGTEDAGDLTRPGFQTFTPRYASPEQVLGQSITVASDIYSLGVLLYVLLTNSHPYELNEFTTEEMVRVICGQEPRRPSAAGVSVGKLDFDLDSIVLKALRKVPRDRYTTVEQFATDIQAYLEQRPVLARRGSLRYRTGKFLRRNTLVLVGTSLLAVSLVIGAVGIVWQSRVANVQRQKAEARSADLRELSTSLLTEIAEAVKSLPGSTSVQHLLVGRVLQHLDRLSGEADNDPLLALDMLNAYTRLGNLQGNPYGPNIGDPKGGLQSLNKALSFAKILHADGSKDRAVLNAYGFAEQSHSELLYAVGRDAESTVALQHGLTAFDALAARTDATADELSAAAGAYNALGDQRDRKGVVDPNDPLSSAAAYRTDRVLMERALKINPDLTRARRSIALIAAKIGMEIQDVDPAGSIIECRRSLAAWAAMPTEARLIRSNHQGESFALRALGFALGDMGSYKAAIDAYRQATLIDEPYATADPKDTSAVYWLAVDLSGEARIETLLLDPNLYPNRKEDAQHRQRAINLYRSSIVLGDRLVALYPDNPTWLSQNASSKVSLGTLQYGTAQAEQGRVLAARALAILRLETDKPNEPLLMQVPAVLASLDVLPASLRNPAWTLHAAERLNSLVPNAPSYLLALAQSYRMAGKPVKAAEVARRGLARMAPTKAGDGESRVRRSLETEAHADVPSN
jgi:serine/threonine protein kinase/tetratricopeptide (TPR) repeat protein